MNRGTFDFPYALFSPIPGVKIFSFPTTYLTYREDAEAFIYASGITDTGHIKAIKKLVYYLQLTGLWNKIKACYPFVGGNSNSHSYNLKDPANYQLSYFGGLTHSSSGVATNGSSGYMNTNFVASNLKDQSNCLFLYSTTNNIQSTSDTVDMGAFNSTNQAITLFISGTTTHDKTGGRYNGNPAMILSNTDSSGSVITKGFFVGNRLGSLSVVYRNLLKLGSQIATAPTSNVLPSFSIYLGNMNFGGSGPYSLGYTNQNYAFAGISDGLTDEEICALTLIIEDYQTNLNRNVIVW